MKRLTTCLAIAIALVSVPASAQTADEIIEKALTALGGRAALGKIKSRSMVGTITIGTPGGDIQGTIELLNAVPNKTRTLIKADLSALGAGPLTIDQRFDGANGYILDSLQGDREMTGSQLEYARNNAFPTPFLNYKDLGMTAKLTGKEKVGDRDAYVLLLEPVSGPAVRQYIDAETYLPMRTVVKIDVPQLGQTLEQTSDFSDLRDVDGVKVPFRVVNSSAIQTLTVRVTKVEHNVPVDEKLFAKPSP